MKPYNDLGNPYIWLISLLSLIPSIVIYSTLGQTIMDQVGLITWIVVITSPIAITYYLLWKMYVKSNDYARRYKNKSQNER